jgi:hypothetical protein
VRTHSFDGCRSINRIKGSGKVYEYPRYEFTNYSADIRHIFCHSSTRSASPGGR